MTGSTVFSAGPDPTCLRAVSVDLPARRGAGPTGAPFGRATSRGRFFAGRRVVAGLGAAAVLPLPRGLEDKAALAEVGRWLDAVPHEHLTRGLVAARCASAGAVRVVGLGAFPFDRTAPACLVVPERTWCEDADGRRWVLDVGPAGRPPPPVGDLVAPMPHPARPVTSSAHGPLEVTSHPDPAGYAAAVAAALQEIAAGRLRKVVLARALQVRLGSAEVPDAAVVLDRLWGGDPAFTAFSMPVPGGRLVGASPELIVERRGCRVVSHPLAGTVRLAGPDDDGAASALARSTKDLAEHRAVVEEIAAALSPRCARLDVPPAPTVVRLGSDARLGTLVRGTLRAGGVGAGPGTTALSLLGDLHPTPAVGGVPRAAALAHIAASEPEPRRYWAGAVGWTDATGDGEWALAIRSVTLRPGGADVAAGAGIVAGSVPDAELAETTLKLSPVLEALSGGASSLL